MDKVLEDIEKLKDANRERYALQEWELCTMIEAVVGLLDVCIRRDLRRPRIQEFIWLHAYGVSVMLRDSLVNQYARYQCWTGEAETEVNIDGCKSHSKRSSYLNNVAKVQLRDRRGFRQRVIK